MHDSTNPRSVAAAFLGSLSKGKAKTLSDEQREQKRVVIGKLNTQRKMKIEAKKKAEAELKELVKARAGQGIFTPIQTNE